MLVQGHLMWLAHVLPACGTENLVEDVAFETIDLDDSVWTILPPKGGAAVDGYLFHLGAKAIPIQSQTLLVQTVTGAIAEETYTVSFDIRQAASLGVDSTSCTVNLLFNGANAGTSPLIAGSWKTISKQWTAVDSEVDMFILIDCPDATMSGTTVDLTHISFEKRCGSSTSASVSVPIKTPSGPPVATSTSLASSVSPSGHPSSKGSGSPSDMLSDPPSSTIGPITLATTITGPWHRVLSLNHWSTSIFRVHRADNPASVDPSMSLPAETPTPDMTTSTVFTTRTATITACPSTVTNCPATKKTTHITTETIVISTTVCLVEDATTTTEGSSPTGPAGDETIVAGTTSVPINTAVTTTAPGEAEGEGSTGSGSSFTSGVSAGNHAGHLSNLPSITHTLFPGTTLSPTAADAGADAGTGLGSTSESSSSASASPVFNGASYFTVSSVLPVLGVISAVALFL
ncbi:hypothetical protein N7519_002830 [Penicillium mononematosum]|uniref:uncharacterized protein n=1 Tax=Penicillium mononematosum TaxID=268346 RepID=UPI0025483646|nr:uncharacterized protein N7519_002830 [Penicillium mononematosum]KAJ6187922.1 hypothetical protein N7519_002830 [Penicillium mononematosum]